MELGIFRVFALPGSKHCAWSVEAGVEGPCRTYSFSPPLPCFPLRVSLLLSVSLENTLT